VFLGLRRGSWFWSSDNPWNYRVWVACFREFTFIRWSGLRCAENNAKRAQCKKLSINFCFHFVAKIRAYRAQGINNNCKNHVCARSRTGTFEQRLCARAGQIDLPLTHTHTSPLLTAANFAAYKRVNEETRNKMFDENKRKEKRIKAIFVLTFWIWNQYGDVSIVKLNWNYQNALFAALCW